MFSSYQEISGKTALVILNSINQPNVTDIIENLKARCTDELDVQTDITQIQHDKKTKTTTKEALIQARLV